MNNWLENEIRDKSFEIETASKCLYHAGILLPISSRGQEKDSERVIVGLASKLSRVFNTKSRAPYMVPLETVELAEVKKCLKREK